MNVIKIQIRGLSDVEYNRFLFLFLYFKFTYTLKNIYLEIIFNKGSHIETKNEYINYLNYEIKKDLEYTQIYVTENSDVDIEFSDTFKVDNIKEKKLLYVKVNLILEFFENIDPTKIPKKFNETLFSKLYFMNDHFKGHSYFSIQNFDINTFNLISSNINDYIQKNEHDNFFFLTDKWYDEPEDKI